MGITMLLAIAAGTVRVQGGERNGTLSWYTRAVTNGLAIILRPKTSLICTFTRAILITARRCSWTLCTAGRRGTPTTMGSGGASETIVRSSHGMVLMKKEAATCIQ